MTWRTILTVAAGLSAMDLGRSHSSAAPSGGAAHAVVAASVSLMPGAHAGYERESDTATSRPLHLGGPYDLDPKDWVANIPGSYRPPKVSGITIEGLTLSDLQNYMPKIYYEVAESQGGLTMLPCTGGAIATGCLMPLFVQPVANMHHFDFETLGPNDWVVIARIISYGGPPSSQESRFGFKTQTRAWWVIQRAGDPTAAPQFISRFVTRAYDAKGPVLTDISTAKFAIMDCGHPVPANRARSRARFSDCAHALSMPNPQLTRRAHGPSADDSEEPSEATTTGTLPDADYAISELWITCNQGCCSTDTGSKGERGLGEKKDKDEMKRPVGSNARRPSSGVPAKKPAVAPQPTPSGSAKP